MIKYTEEISSDSTRKPFWFEIGKMVTAVLKNKLIVSFMIIFGAFSLPVPSHCTPRNARHRV